MKKTVLAFLAVITFGLSTQTQAITIDFTKGVLDSSRGEFFSEDGDIAILANDEYKLKVENGVASVPFADTAARIVSVDSPDSDFDLNSITLVQLQESNANEVTFTTDFGYEFVVPLDFQNINDRITIEFGSEFEQLPGLEFIVTADSNLSGIIGFDDIVYPGRSFNSPSSPVPVPGAVWLLGTAMVSLLIRKKIVV